MTMIVSTDPVEAISRGERDAMQDACENAPFASIGGLGVRASAAWELPKYVSEPCRDGYLRGYTDQCRRMYGEDWRTVEFGWVPAIEISKDGVRVFGPGEKP